jgi:hypothetical protein
MLTQQLECFECVSEKCQCLSVVSEAWQSLWFPSRLRI